MPTPVPVPVSVSVRIPREWADLPAEDLEFDSRVASAYVLRLERELGLDFEAVLDAVLWR